MTTITSTGIQFPDGTTQTTSNDNVLGYNQVWTNVKASRAANTWYANNSTRPIAVAVTVAGVEQVMFYVVVDGVEFLANQLGTNPDSSALVQTVLSIVPPDASYRVLLIPGYTIEEWHELI